MKYVKIPVMPDVPVLAQAYVPFQTWPEKLYDLDAGFREGTIFPELNQPMSWYEMEDCE